MKIFTLIIIIVVSVVIILGFIFGGSPKEARLFRFDEIRVSNLQEIQFQIIQYLRVNDELSESLEQIKPFISESALKDPQTDEPYLYSKTAELKFKLCADFGLEQSEDGKFSRPFAPRIESFPIAEEKTDNRQYHLQDGSWNHSAGEHCFEREIVIVTPN